VSFERFLTLLMLMVLEKYHGRNWVAIAFIHEGIILVPIHLFVGELISTLGLKASQEELDRMIDEIDKDGDGTIDFNEFCSVMSHRVSQTYTPEEVKHAFKVFQGEAPLGYVNVKYLEKALNTYSGDKQAVSDAVDLLLQVDPDGTGYINYVEYVEMMTAK